ncbi:MAG: MerR family transcriptional regulator [Candidatus Krumholzibacteriia bacterium]
MEIEIRVESVVQTGTRNSRDRISEASRRVGLHPRTLMLYERMGLLVPQRQGHQRRYSDDDLRWLGCIREINHRGGVSLAGIRAFLRYLPCWALRGCAMRSVRDVSPARFDREAALRTIAKILGGQALEVCRSCGYYQSSMVTASGAPFRAEN